MASDGLILSPVHGVDIKYDDLYYKAFKAIDLIVIIT